MRTPREAPPSQGEQPPLDVQPLRDSGMLPSVPEDEKTATNNVLREVYFGNLQAGMVDEEAGCRSLHLEGVCQGEHQSVSNRHCR